MKSDLRFWCINIWLLICFNLLSCAGGGTTGTGGGSVQVSGSLKSGQTPRSGVHVSASSIPVNRKSIRSSLNEADTDNQGNFTLFVDVMAGETIQLDFKGGGIDSSYQFSALPDRTAIIEADFDYDDESGEVREDSVKYEDENGNEID